MDFSADRYREWVGHRVVIKANTESKIVEFDGELIAVHDKAIMVRPKGRVQYEIIDAKSLESFELFDEKPKAIVPKRMAHIIFQNTRQHLADRHGFDLNQLNSEEFTNQVAYDVHEAEHIPGAAPMSHYHEG